MTEFSLTLGNPALAAHVLGVAAIKYEVDKDAEAVAICNSMAAQIEAQVKPAVEEPKEFGSMVKATTKLRTVGQPGLFWVKIGGAWTDDGAGVSRQWGDLDVIEVLRVGVGPQPLAEWESDLLNEQARRDTAAAVLAAMDVDQYLIDAVVNARPR